MSGGSVAVLILLTYLLSLPSPSSSHPLCTDSRAPYIPNTPLTFCPYNGSVCCDSTQDSELQTQFQAMNVTDTACARVVKSILCARCDQFSAELFNSDSGVQTVPVLCNSSRSYCAEIWETCRNASLLNSPFTPPSQGSEVINSTSKLTDLWQSQNAFCRAFGGASGNGSMCFDGNPVKLNDTQTQESPNGLCLEKIGNESYLNMAAHPDGSNRIFLASQEGKIWLATVPEVGSGGTLEFDLSSPFLDITDEVHYDSEFGVMGMAFHPNFTRNGRFFVSFNCDKVTSPRCSGRCSCNSDASCDPSTFSADNNEQPCRYHSVIAEFTANGTASQPSSAITANPTEVRRIFTMGLPFSGHHAGQILFGPTDGYMYFLMGDGGGVGDPYNFAQNKKSLLGKVMRLDVDRIPSEAEVTALGLWGNYSIPADNPYSEDEDLLPEIWSLGLRNPWRCSFDSERPSYFLCADIGQEVYEEVNLITKGGNYGWRVYEGDSPYHPPQSPGGNTSVSSINAISPVAGYTHSDVNKNEGSASITGGYFYRSAADPCMYGRYLYADLYGGAIWAASETPENSGNFTSSRLPFKCAVNSPTPCNSDGNDGPSLGYIFSFGEDNSHDILILGSSGVHRVVSPSQCSYTCSKEIVTVPDIPGDGPSSTGNHLRSSKQSILIFFLLSTLLFSSNL